MSEPYPLYDEQQVCKQCGTIFTGKSFHVPTTTEPKLVIACTPCAQRASDAVQQIVTGRNLTRLAPEPELAPPRQAG